VTHATTPELDPPCPPAPAGPDRPGAQATTLARPTADRTLRAVRRPFDAIAPATWDRLAAANPWATPFSGWAFHRAWWDAYGAHAHEQTFVAVPADGPDGAEPVAIIPLMHRHEVEPDDAILRTRLRGESSGGLTEVAPTAKAVFLGATYHADYATLLAAPADLPAAAGALAAALADPRGHGDADHTPWDVVDLRRLRAGDPAGDALERAFAARAAAEGWVVTREREDVCPVVTIVTGVGFEDYLGTLGKKERHEIRRKVRRAEAAGTVALLPSPDPVADLDAFVDLHQKRWGADGLFPATPGGDQSRTFFRRLFELAAGTGTVQLRFLTVDGRRIAAGVWLEDERAIYFYNAGVDPGASELSPGVLLSARAIATAVADGRSRFDFLRGDESYKYEWGAVDEPIERILVARGAG
jgi:CelD/BcsL family acetyltransferase involved in cellulose biosynthesis